ncbi:MAG: 2-polyprenyl-3-methyl-6-methoxy-1,4-benzoquinone monooxygenase, partial [Gammaproteobacteria bacterium]|nr:2-polyprenyl-3-methyl-6-methoxy-1,4-benzoquinone monooxygenase [Gammaproteobacteria bacterium]
MKTTLSPLDRLIIGFDRALRTINPGATSATRPSPAELAEQEAPADSIDVINKQRHTAGLMRINHTGEVCAQALYRGQALTARSNDVRDAMQESALEEEDHLAWCEQRLSELNAKPSLLNPAFYLASFGMGALAGMAGDRISLGFIAATEDQVCEHLREHLQQVPNRDQKTRLILEQMLEDEAAHGNKAIQ